MLGVSPDSLKSIGDAAQKMYREVPQKKKDGSLRMTYDAHPSLKKIQDKISKLILKKVVYPDYLQGGLPKKDQVSNAAKHSKAIILIQDDIEDFYPSLSDTTVRGVWQQFFKFSPEVAKLLTSLTTLNGKVPQGAKTSSYLANLAFWDCEHLLVQKLLDKDLTYTRFADDIIVSTRAIISNSEIAVVRASIYNMLALKSCKPKRSKSRVCRKGTRLSVTGLNTSLKSPMVNKQERRKIRALLHNLEVSVSLNGYTAENVAAWESIRGKVVRLKRLRHKEALGFDERLHLLKSRLFSSSSVL
ncbi:retron reverse transcriptase [Thalassolituus oleivorans MIL-1]|uniref:Retron reverse transcriptase n=1 Tax=Thalassolituus oleivorans MIL-1 TaxID=1298593 RepID=M5DN18_9GAMM|nr:retron reverse transcriptase [Thalassolituus oleivorans MIL-1]